MKTLWRVGVLAVVGLSAPMTLSAQQGRRGLWKLDALTIAQARGAAERSKDERIHPAGETANREESFDEYFDRISGQGETPEALRRRAEGRSRAELKGLYRELMEEMAGADSDGSGESVRVADVTESAGHQPADEFSGGVLQPIYLLAEVMAFSFVYWFVFAVMTASAIIFAMQLMLGKRVVLTQTPLNLEEVLVDALGLIVSLAGVVLTTQAAAENSAFTNSPLAVLTAAGLGAVLGFGFYWWRQVVEVEAQGGRRATIPNALAEFVGRPGAAEAPTEAEMEARRRRVRSAAHAAQIRSDELEAMDIAQAVDVLVERAAWLQASDLFFLADPKAVNVSLRRFGELQPVAVLSEVTGRHAINHVKVLADMDISEHRRPMDGRWVHESDGARLDIRINSTPTLYGEDLAMRIWNRTSGLRKLDALGLFPRDLSILKAMLAEPSGLILVTGPTGTGKTTTLYACLEFLSGGSRKLNAIEDPVEYVLPGVRQSQVNEGIGNDFPELLRSVFRQAPDVIMIGEVRDPQTADTAVRAANSGQLVLATLHSPIASGAVQSMRAFGTKPLFLSTSLLGVIAQRLVRTLCRQCRTFVDLSGSPQTFEQIRDMLEEGQGRGIYASGRCDACHQTGYAGRTGVFEIMKMNKELRRMITEGASSLAMEQAAIRSGMTEFRRGALLKVAEGITSIEEILRDVPAEYLGLED